MVGNRGPGHQGEDSVREGDGQLVRYVIAVAVHCQYVRARLIVLSCDVHIVSEFTECRHDIVRHVRQRGGHTIGGELGGASGSIEIHTADQRFQPHLEYLMAA